MYHTHRSLHKFNLGFAIIIVLILSAPHFIPILNHNSQRAGQNSIEDISEISENESTEIFMSQNTRSAITLTINEVMANAENEDTGEYVEFYNYGTNPINLSGWYVQDPKDKNDRITDYIGEYDIGLKGTEIPPSGYCIYIDPEYSGEYNSLLTAQGDLTKVIMVTCDSDTTIGNGLTNSQDTIILNNSAGFLIERTWSENSGNNNSMGLIPDGAGPWIVHENPTPGYSNGMPPKIVINEFMYNPKGKEVDGEWVELYNADSISVNLSSWKLSDGDKNTLDLPDLEMPVNSYLVLHIGKSPEALNGFYENNEFNNGTAHIYFNRTSSILTNTGDCLNLSISGGLCIDYMAYGNRTSIPPPVWYVNWVGNNQITSEGNSLALIPNGLLEDTAIHWTEKEGEEITQGWNNEHVYRLEVEPEETEIHLEVGNEHLTNITVTNNGTVDSLIDIGLSSPPTGWAWSLSETAITLQPNDSHRISLTVIAPDDFNSKLETLINISLSIQDRPEIYKLCQVEVSIPSVELSAKWLKVGSVDEKTLFNEGEIISLRGRVYNGGILPAGQFEVQINVVSTNTNELVLEKIFHYDYLKSKGSKYPSVQWDTLGYFGNFTASIIVDSGNQQHEGKEADNILSEAITVLSTKPAMNDRSVLIKEVYYDTLLSGEPDEYIILFNPLYNSINISQWQIGDGEGIIVFPEDTAIQPQESIVVTQDGLGYEQITGSLADFEIISSHPSIPEMEMSDYGFKLTNTGDEIILRTQNRHIIDVVTYGTSSYTGDGWIGSPVLPADEGLVLRRVIESQNSDTNTSSDWFWFSETRPGQSSFTPSTFKGEANITAFVTPDCGLEPLIELIRDAKVSIDIASYTLTNEIIKDELIEALDRKVHIRILLAGELGNTEDENSENLKTIPSMEWKVVSELYSRGARIQFMAGQPELGVESRYSAVNSKYIIVDSRSVLVTSENFGWNAFPSGQYSGYRGYGIIIDNQELAGYLTELFEFDWNQSRPDSISFDPQDPIFDDIEFNSQHEENLFYKERGQSSYSSIDSLKTGGQTKVTPIIGPDNIFKSGTVLDLLETAEMSLSIALFKADLNWTMDFDGNSIPNPFLSEVIDAARAGIKIKILLDPEGFSPSFNSNMDSSILTEGLPGSNLEVVHYINEVSLDEGITGLLEARIAYLDGLDTLHGNMVIIDSETVLISSFNWEYEGLRANRELGLVIENPETADYYQSVFQNDWEHSPGVLNDELIESSRILITELYYDTYVSSEPDEYIKLYNPSNAKADLSGWFITDGEGILWLPNGTILKQGESLVITRSASAFRSTFGFLPDFEFITNSERNVTGLKVLGGLFQLSNSGDELVVLDFNGDEVDSVIYGNSEYFGSGWMGSPVPDISEGQILKRIKSESTGRYFDTDTCEDWLDTREYYPGQSQFPFRSFIVNRTEINTPSMTAFVSPDSSFKVIYDELADARSSIFINVYQFDHPELLELLIDQSYNGVEVYILIEGDPVGGLSYTAKRYAYELQQAGCSVRLMITDPARLIHDRYAVDHAKYAVIDSSTVIVMSENWKQTGVPSVITAGNRGTGVVIRNSEIADYFIKLYEIDSSHSNSDIIEFDINDPKYGLDEIGIPINNEDNPEIISNPSRDYQPRFNSKDFLEPAIVKPIISPDHSLLEHGSILEALRSAKHSVLIEQLQCYRFWTGVNGSYPNLYLEAVMDAARRGCNVKILLDSAYEDKNSGINSNTAVVDYVNSISQKEGLLNNLEARLIHLEDRTGGNGLVKLHNKGIIVDSRIVYVGSMNWGTGGPIRNREVGVLIEQKGIAQYFEEIFYFDWNLSLRNHLEISIPYSNQLSFTGYDKTLYSELGLFNLNNSDNITFEINANIYDMNDDNADHQLFFSIEKESVILKAGDFESIALSLTLVNGLHNNYNAPRKCPEYDHHCPLAGGLLPPRDILPL
jgi:phosphatidylserine/phosphatidylglycerophosphate/cardiolipin synthase-like enzyme